MLSRHVNKELKCQEKQATLLQFNLIPQLIGTHRFHKNTPSNIISSSKIKQDTFGFVEEIQHAYHSKRSRCHGVHVYVSLIIMANAVKSGVIFLIYGRLLQAIRTIS